MRFLILTAGFAVAAGAASATVNNAITPAQAAGNRGQCMTVEGQVHLHPASVRFGADLSFESTGGFVTAYIPAPQGFGDLSRFDGQTVDITGVIEPGHYGGTQILLTTPEQIMMADETPDRLVTCENF